MSAERWQDLEREARERDENLDIADRERRDSEPEPPAVVQRGAVTPRSRARRAEITKPQVPQGFRSTRRTSKALKNARRAVRKHEWLTSLEAAYAAARGRTIGAFTLGVLVLAGAAVTILVLVLVATGINSIARWQAERAAARLATPEGRQEQARENLLVIGVEKGKARGFLAMRIDSKERQAFGFAIPDGALMEVPGRGFERVSDSFGSGPDSSLATISNYLTVPFDRYITVPYESYQAAVQQQRIDGLLAAVDDTNLDDRTKADLSSEIRKVGAKDVAIAPLPVKAITVGNQTYYEPQRQEVADLLKSWWGVTMTTDTKTRRVVVQNGSGVPGIAGEAAQELIKAGYRVVTTGNANRFDYKRTQIIVEHGSPADGNKVAGVLGVGKISEQPSDQQIADIIVIVGKDYKPGKRQR